MSSVEDLRPKELAARDKKLLDGAVAAALLGTASGCVCIAVFTIAADASRRFATALTFYTPTGPLSGVSSLSLFAWLVTWWILGTRWRKKAVPGRRIVVGALTLLVTSMAVTFPPVLNLILGR